MSNDAIEIGEQRKKKTSESYDEVEKEVSWMYYITIVGGIILAFGAISFVFMALLEDILTILPLHTCR